LRYQKIDRWLLLGAAFFCGCTTTPGARYSVWPTQKAFDPTAIGSDAASAETDSLTGKISSTAKGVKGQLAGVGTAVTSVYGKAKTAMSSAFTGTTNPASDPVDATSLGTGNTAGIGPEMHVITGHTYEMNGNYVKAIDCYSKALEAEPTNLAALTSMARLHDRQNNASKSVEFYQKAITIAPQQASLHAELGNVQARLGQVATAKEQYQKAINLDVKNQSYRSSMAALLIDEGQAEQAEQELGQVVSPAMAKYQMAYLYMSRQNIPTAKQYLGGALTLDPNLKPARDMMNSLGGVGMIQQAGALAQQTNQLYQQTSQAMANVGQALNTAPQTATAPTSGSIMR
jgi:Tfp pilus assembly protein PilF